MSWPLPYPQIISTKNGEWTITYHAIRQFYKRYLEAHPDIPTEDKDSLWFFYERFVNHLFSAVEVERTNSLWQTVKYGQEAHYFRNKKGYGRWIFVVADKSVVTAMRFQPEKGIYKKKKKRR